MAEPINHDQQILNIVQNNNNEVIVIEKDLTKFTSSEEQNNLVSLVNKNNKKKLKKHQNTLAKIKAKAACKMTSLCSIYIATLSLSAIGTIVSSILAFHTFKDESGSISIILGCIVGLFGSFFIIFNIISGCVYFCFYKIFKKSKHKVALQKSEIDRFNRVQESVVQNIEDGHRPTFLQQKDLDIEKETEKEVRRLEEEEKYEPVIKAYNEKTESEFIHMLSFNQRSSVLMPDLSENTLNFLPEQILPPLPLCVDDQLEYF